MLSLFPYDNIMEIATDLISMWRDGEIMLITMISIMLDIVSFFFRINSGRKYFEKDLTVVSDRF